MTDIITAGDYAAIHHIVFSPDYPGYRPNVVESPNGDANWDTEKRYSHIALKYLEQYEDEARRDMLTSYLVEAHNKALEVARMIGVPDAFMPDIRYGALRILDYPPGAVTHPHKDFDLFTLMLYRNQPDKFKYLSGEPAFHIQTMSKQIHYGEILEMVMPEHRATEHEVEAVTEGEPHQHSAVYFTIPDHATVLPSGETVGEWLDERMGRSRKVVA